MNDLFEKYLNNELSDEQKAEFLHQLKIDESLNQDFQHFMLAKNALLVSEDNHLRNIIQQHKPDESPVISNRKVLAIAASVILLVGLGITFYIFSTPNANEQLFQAYFEPATYYGNYTRSNLDPAGNLDKGIAFYLNGDLEQAETFLTEVTKNSDDQQLRQRASLYLGLVALQKDQDKQALEILEKLFETNQVYDETTLEWILALTYLKNDMIDKAAPLLTNICEQAENKYADKSCELVKELNGA